MAPSKDNNIPWENLVDASSQPLTRVIFTQRLTPELGEVANILNMEKVVGHLLQTAANTLGNAAGLEDLRVEQTPGPWCHAMPLWGNPLLQCENGGYEFSEAGYCFSHCPWQTLGELLREST